MVGVTFVVVIAIVVVEIAIVVDSAMVVIIVGGEPVKGTKGRSRC